MISLKEARELIAARTPPLEAVEVALAEAHGRVLRAEVRAEEDFPAFDRSSMDGYAVAGDDLSERFAVIGEVQPGSGSLPTIGDGECVRIFTGAAIPPGASQVIMQEDVRREGEVMIPRQRDERTNIRRRGEDAKAGDLLLPEGTRLGAAELGMLAQAGRTRVPVTRAAQVIHVTTGGELVPPDRQPGPGQIRDSNSTLIAALVRETGAELQAQGRCIDDPAALRGWIEAQGESWDVLLISGGASVGDYDFGARVLRELGFEIVFSKVNLKPGKPLVFASRGRQVAFVIPGNPVSHFVTFHVAIRAALERPASPTEGWPLVEVELAEGLREARDVRETYAPARVYWDGKLKTTPIKVQSSGDLYALVGANGLIQRLPPCEAIEPGATALCLIPGFPSVIPIATDARGRGAPVA